MNWYHSKKDQLPKDKQEVVISIGGIYRIATFNNAKKVFTLKHQPQTDYKVKDHEIYWTDSL